MLHKQREYSLLMQTYSTKSNTYLRKPALFIVLLCGLACLSPVYAQETEDFEVWSSLSETMGLITDLEHDVKDLSEAELLIRVGVIGGVAPEFRGSDEYNFSAAPNLHIVWNNFIYLKGRKLGLQLLDSESFYAGVFVRYTGGRSDRNDGLEGLGDISRTFTSGAYFNYRHKGIRLKSEVRHDFFNEGHGTLAIFSLGTRIPWEMPLFYLGIESTWASKEYMASFFGVNNFQSMRSGLSRYSPDAGIRDVSLNLGSGYEFGEHWSIAGQLRFQHLLGDAADSPIVTDSGSRNSFVLGLGLNYTF